MEAHAMPYYMLELAYTPESFKAMIAHPTNRREAAEKTVEALGGKVHQFFFAFGRYDAIVIIEAPDDAAMAAGAMAVAASGALSGGRTTKLLTAEDGMAAMKAAGAAAGAYKPPGS
jgi:uncharacterized protein with GYD domain